MKVMIVDDAATNRATLEQMINEWGYEVAAAADGEHALRLLRKETRPVLLLLDWIMPGLSGLDLCAALKKEKPASQIYIILLTVKNGKDDITLGLDADADDYLTRPVTPALLRCRLAIGRRILEYQHALDALSRELQAKKRELNRLATLDGLTGITSRGHFNQRLDEEWRRARRDNTPLTLILIDIDLFKYFNDAYGYIAGDECLKEVARVLAASVTRAGDLVARFGGEQFAVLLPNTDKLGALVIAEAIRVAIAACGIEHKASSVHRAVTASVGTATILAPEGAHQGELIERAKKALARAKKSGRNQVVQA